MINYIENLKIPEKLRVGFQEREDTLSGKLAFVVPIDKNGKIRQEDSWNGWCDKSLGFIDIENKPQSNFILNKDIQRYTDFGRSPPKVRVHDPRGYEFEIPLTNMLYILMHSDVSKRDIAEDCVLAWSGKDLVLIPVNSESYLKSVKQIAINNTKFSSKNLVPGHTYQSKKNVQLVYLGFYNYLDTNDIWETNSCSHRSTIKTLFLNQGKKHWFYSKKDNNYIVLPPSDIYEEISNEIDSRFSFHIEKINTLRKFSTSGKFKLVDGKPNFYIGSSSGLLASYDNAVLKIKSFVFCDKTGTMLVYDRNLTHFGAKFNHLKKLLEKRQTIEIIEKALSNAGFSSIAYFDENQNKQGYKVIRK